MIWDNITKGWKNIFNFTGRASRAEFWLLVLSGSILSLTLLILGVLLPFFTIVFYIIVFPAFAIASLSVTIRRTRDTGASGWFGVLAFLTGIFALIVGFIPSKNPEAVDSSSNRQQKPSPEIKDFHYTPEMNSTSSSSAKTNTGSSNTANVRLPLKDFN